MIENTEIGRKLFDFFKELLLDLSKKRVDIPLKINKFIWAIVTPYFLKKQMINPDNPQLGII